jgi:hypothetical protein
MSEIWGSVRVMNCPRWHGSTHYWFCDALWTLRYKRLAIYVPCGRDLRVCSVRTTQVMLSSLYTKIAGIVSRFVYNRSMPTAYECFKSLSQCRSSPWNNKNVFFKGNFNGNVTHRWVWAFIYVVVVMVKIRFAKCGNTCLVDVDCSLHFCD